MSPTTDRLTGISTTTTAQPSTGGARQAQHPAAANPRAAAAPVSASPRGAAGTPSPVRAPRPGTGEGTPSSPRRGRAAAGTKAGSGAGRGTLSAAAGRPLPAAQAAMAAAMSEAELEEHVRELCKGLGIIRIHVYNSRGTTPGVPDDILIGPEGILWRELKTQRGKLTAAQQTMGEALAAAGQDWAVWRPASLASGAIAAELAGISAWQTRRGTRCVCDQYGSCPQGCAMCRVCGGAA